MRLIDYFKSYALTLKQLDRLPNGYIRLLVQAPTDLSWQPAACGQILLPHHKGGRTLTIASLPQEETLVLLTVASSSPYKQALLTLQPGDSLTLKFLSALKTPDLEPNTPLLAWAAGAGIAAIRPLLLHRLSAGAPIRFTYWHQGCHAFDSELDQWMQQYPHFHWQAHDHLASCWKDLANWRTDTAHILLAGSPRYVKQLARDLRQDGVPNRQLHLHPFTGLS